MGEADSGEWLRPRLEALAARKLGVPSAQVNDLEPLPGHAGLGFSFRLAPAGLPARRLVVRTLAEGVPAVGPANVVRQARIMRSMAGAGVPAPHILWTGEDDPELGRPYFVAAFVEGYRTPDDSSLVTEKDRRLARRALEMLPSVHAVEWRSLGKIWGEPQSLEQEFARLLKLYDRPTIDRAQAGRIEALRERLLAALPQDLRIGCVHGDFHLGNIIFGEDHVAALVDWELAFIGPVLLDLGWICFYADPQSFTGALSERARRFGLTPEEMIEAYRSRSAYPAPDEQVAWFRAFSAYRFGVISLFNCMLHRRGKRHDPMWEQMAASTPQMAERALEILG